ncbi:hypothetical protein [Nonomuraea rubra]|uniref:hypothetical protein n=1 Tax=Nonomuraea rubra TaxID=46180 RepID=UPI0031EB0186
MSAAPPPAGLPPRTPSRSYPPHEASRLRRIRQYAVPPWMVEQATERRLAGDWRGACAAANVEVTFDLAGIAGTHGTRGRHGDRGRPVPLRPGPAALAPAPPGPRAYDDRARPGDGAEPAR